MGNGASNDEYAIPTQIGNSDWKSVSAGHDHSMGITSTGALWVWGANDYGQIGNGSTSAHASTSIVVDGVSSWKVAVAGKQHSLAIREDDKLYAWGSREYGKIGDSGASSGNQLTPIQAGALNDTWIAIAAGDNHSLGIKSDHSLYAWGNNDHGQLGGSITGGQSYNSPQLAGAGWQSVFAGNFHSLGVLDNGGIWAWGRNNRGQIGNGSTGASASANILGTWKTASAGGLFSIAVRE